VHVRFGPGATGKGPNTGHLASGLPVLREAPDTPCLVAIGIDGGCPVLEVHDCSPEGVELRPADFVSEHGRGLHVVDALCAEWDCVQSGGGSKAVIVRLAKGEGKRK
jgi:hypothetical protein